MLRQRYHTAEVGQVRGVSLKYGLSCTGEWAGRFWQPGPKPPREVELRMPASCVCTELKAISSRVLVDRQVATPLARRAFVTAMRRIKSSMRDMPRPEPLAHEAFVASAPGGKRALYAQAYRSLQDQPLGYRDWQVTMQVKAEVSYNKVILKPRALQFRNPRFNIEYGRYIRPIAQDLRKMRGPCRGVTRTPMIASGNSWSRAELLMRKLAEFASPAVLRLDAKSFDASLWGWQLRQAHGAYLSRIDTPEFRRLLSVTIANKVRSRRGIRYAVEGRRMSGDMDTSCGNSLISCATCGAIASLVGIHKWDAMVDGDDIILIHESSAGDLLSAIRRATLDIGFVSECDYCIEPWAPLLPERIRFNSGFFFEVEPGLFRYIRDADRCLSTFGVSHKAYQSSRGGARYLKAAALCELACNEGVPCVQALCLRVLELTHNLQPSGEIRGAMSYRALKEVPSLADVRGVPVTPHMREQFARVYGIDPAAQVEYELRVGVLELNDLLNFRSVGQEYAEGIHEFVCSRNV